MENEMGYVLAQGPEGLHEVLSDLLAKTNADLGGKAEAHYILYELGSQKSMIKVDMSRRPFHFWHYDLLGRPATLAIKEVIARFLWEKCGEKDVYIEGIHENG